MELARIGTKGVSHGVGGREGNGEEVGLGPRAQPHRLDAGERGLERHLVHHRIVREDARGDAGVTRDAMRKRIILSAVLDWYRVGLRIGGGRQQQ